MGKYVIGVDGGGTKTEAVLVDSTGKVISRVRGGSSNYQALGPVKLKEVLISIINELYQNAMVPVANLQKIYLGLAGAGRLSDQQEIKAIFADTEFKNLITVNSDAIIALAGAFNNQPGIILIAGTGAICFGKNSQGEIVRSGGWGYLLGDEGGGYYIGKRAIIAALKDFDGRGEATQLRNIIEKKFQLDSIDLIIPLIYKNMIDRVAIADLAPIVFEQAKGNDNISKQIIKDVGIELGCLAKAVAKRLDFSDEKIKIALIGSIFKQRDMLVNEISKELFEVSWDIQIMDPNFDPAIGAAILALGEIGVELNETRLENLTTTKNVQIS
ncbi:hypothetical protein JXB12_07855 [candidate division KSB1 bacterium]|nr:hypothetical protein [candidate division KSB1 bacterium]